MKKLISIILSVLLVFTIIPLATFSASAEDGVFSVDPEKAGESSTDTVYPTLQDAISAAVSAGVSSVRLDTNITITKTVKISCDYFSLDMNGHSITYSPSKSSAFYEQSAIWFYSTNASSSPMSFTLRTKTAAEATTKPRTDADGTFVNNSGCKYFFNIDASTDYRRSMTTMQFSSSEIGEIFGDVTVRGALNASKVNIHGNILCSSALIAGENLTVYGNITGGRYIDSVYGSAKVYGFVHDTNASDPYTNKYASTTFLGNKIKFFSSYDGKECDTYNGYNFYADSDVDITFGNGVTNATLDISFFVGGNLNITAQKTSNTANNAIKFNKKVTVSGSINGTVSMPNTETYFEKVIFAETLSVGKKLSIDALLGGALEFRKGISSGYSFTDGTNVFGSGEDAISASNVKFYNLPTENEKLSVEATMKNGAAIRLKQHNGIRFYTCVDKEKIAELEAEGATVVMGTLIAPADLIGDSELDFNLPTKNYLNVVTEDYYTEDEFSGVVGSITDIIETDTSWSGISGNVTRKFVGRGYIKVTKNDYTTVSYADYADGNRDNNSRSLAFVSKALVCDTQSYDELAGETKGFVDKWADCSKNPLTDGQKDTTDFSLSSIEMTRKMLVGYNIGDSFEGFENRSNYSRPSNIADMTYYKETLWGNVPATQEYIKYLKDSGVEAIRVPITWFPMINGISGQTQAEKWVSGTIDEKWLDRVQEIVDLILDNGMYCIINTHHDGGCNSANLVRPLVFDASHQAQSVAYIQNIWSQVGVRFRTYGSKLLFEAFNEVADSTGQMSPNDSRDAVATEVLKAFIKTVRGQGGNNANRFLVCPRYGGVSLWSNLSFASADTAADKLILTMHSYPSASGVDGSVKSVQSHMNSKGVGCIIDEIGGVPSNGNDGAFAKNVRTASDNYKVSCFWWDNGQAEFSLVNRYYATPSGSYAFSNYVGKTLENKTYSESEITDAKQPYYIKFYSPDSNSQWGGKYLIVSSEFKATSVLKYSSRVEQGFYSLHGLENGYFTYYTSDDGVAFTRMVTRIATPYSKIMYNDLSVYGSVYSTRIIGGNYLDDVALGNGLQDMSVTGENLFSTGSFVQGAYTAVNTIDTSNDTNKKRISFERMINVEANDCYVFTVSDNYSNTAIRMQIKLYTSEGTCKTTTNRVNDSIRIPVGITQMSVTLYHTSSSYSYDGWLEAIANSTVKPTMYKLI